MLPLITSSLCKSFLVKSLVYVSSLNPRFVSLFQSSLFQSSLLSILRACTLASQVYFSQVSCLFFEPTPLLQESTLAESLVYFSSLHPRFASLFYLSPLSIFQAYILASQLYFSQVSCLFFRPISSLLNSILVD